MVYNFIDKIVTINDNNNHLIILDEDMKIYEIQKEICKKLNNCYIYDDIIKTSKDNNICYINYNNKIYMIYKQMIKKFYIKYIFNI